MSSQFQAPEQWYSEYDEASAKQQYEMLLEIIQTSLLPEFFEEIDLGQLLVEMLDELDNNNLIAEAISLINLLQQYQPELYRQEYCYFDKFLIQHYLYTSELEQVKASLVRFEEYPSENIDKMLQILDFLKFYNATEIATDLCERTYHSIKNSPDVIDGTEIELAEIILLDLMDKAYQKIKIEESVNWDEFSAKAQEYGLKTDQQSLTNIQEDLLKDISIDQPFFQAFKKHQSRQKIYPSLSVAFHKYMADKKQVSFICSQGIWNNILKFLIEERNLNTKKLTHPDSLFVFSQKELDHFVAQQIGGFFSLAQAAGFATLWGVPYLYDFLLTKQIISSEIHLKALSAVSELKKELTERLSQSLWQYDFVHRWLPPDSLSQEDWEAEIEQFKASLTLVKPLSSDEPNLNRIEPFKREVELLRNALEKEESLNKLSDSENKEIDEVSSPSVKSYKPKKTKKSPLQEAAELIAQEEKKPGKKKKKGFN